MKLFYSPNSPYVRKVVMLGLELTLDASIERQPLTLSPYEPNPVVTAQNPLGKIPVLITDDGQPLFDSIVICEYLSAQAGDQQWFPVHGKKRWDALRANAMGDGLLESGQLIRFESLRPADSQYAKWIDAHRGKIDRTLAFLEQHLPASDDIGGLSVVAAIAWIEFRLPQIEWRDQYPKLAAWYGAMDKRPSVNVTRHAG